jgi:hypothetical protein
MLVEKHGNQVVLPFWLKLQRHTIKPHNIAQQNANNEEYKSLI